MKGLKNTIEYAGVQKGLLLKKEQQKGLEKAARIIRNEARKLCPMNSKRLRNSIQIVSLRVRKTVYVVALGNPGWYVERGTPYRAHQKGKGKNKIIRWYNTKRGASSLTGEKFKKGAQFVSTKYMPHHTGKIKVGTPTNPLVGRRKKSLPFLATAAHRKEREAMQAYRNYIDKIAQMKAAKGTESG